MVEVIEFVRAWIERIILQLGYPGIALIMLIENLFPPIPSELVMPLAGFLSGRGELIFVGVVVAGTVGSVLGALSLYGLGWWAGEPIIRRFVRQYGRFFLLDEAELDRVLAIFDRYGEAAVGVGRVIPLVRSLISLPAGMNRMPLSRFLLFTTLGSSVWTLVLATSGLLLGEHWEDVLTLIDRYQKLVIVILVLAVLGWFGTRIVQRRA